MSDVLRQRRCCRLPPDRYLLGSALRHYADQLLLCGGQQLLALAFKSCFAACSFVVASLVDHTSNSVLWNLMVVGLIRNGDPPAALRLFLHMRSAGILPNRFSFPAVLAPAAASSPAVVLQLHASLLCSGHGGNLFIRSSLVDIYAKHGDLPFAELTLCEGGGPNGHASEALWLFLRMLKTYVVGEVLADGKTLLSVVSACVQLGEARLGQWTEAHIGVAEIPLDDLLRTALGGCAGLFEEMVAVEGILPNGMTFMGLLVVYAHAGQAVEVCRCFAAMAAQHEIQPGSEHWGALVDLLGRVGRVEEAHQVVK
ncbi:pentatricopeptide repeat-containing protein At2g33680-like [Wolffia australiana]